MIYCSDLEEYIKTMKRYIPRRLGRFDQLKVFHRYWLPDFGEFKVKDISYNNGTEYYYIVYDNNTKQAVLSYPVSNPSANITECFELLKNYDHIEDNCIINNMIESFTGAEIRFWFIINNIDFTDIENYSGFLPYLVYGNKKSIKDSLVYHCKRDKKENKFEFVRTEKQ